MIINPRMEQCMSKEDIKRMLKAELEMLVNGVSSGSDIMYFEFANSVKDVFEKLSDK